MATRLQVLEQLKRAEVPESEALDAMTTVARLGPHSSYEIPGRDIVVSMAHQGDWQFKRKGNR